MTKDTLAIRINRTNPNHHIYNNNGTWWCHYTRCPTPITAERVRLSLGTKSLPEARKRRDILLGLYDPLTDFPHIAGRKKHKRIITAAPAPVSQEVTSVSGYGSGSAWGDLREAGPG